MKTWLKIVLSIVGFGLSFLFDFGIALLLFSINKGNVAIGIAGFPEIAYIFLLIYLFSRDENGGTKDV